MFYRTCNAWVIITYMRHAERIVQKTKIKYAYERVSRLETESLAIRSTKVYNEFCAKRSRLSNVCFVTNYIHACIHIDFIYNAVRIVLGKIKLNI